MTLRPSHTKQPKNESPYLQSIGTFTSVFRPSHSLIIGSYPLFLDSVPSIFKENTLFSPLTSFFRQRTLFFQSPYPLFLSPNFLFSRFHSFFRPSHSLIIGLYSFGKTSHFLAELPHTFAKKADNLILRPQLLITQPHSNRTQSNGRKTRTHETFNTFAQTNHLTRPKTARTHNIGLSENGAKSPTSPSPYPLAAMR